jgi:hypothetical protein
MRVVNYAHSRARQAWWFFAVVFTVFMARAYAGEFAGVNGAGGENCDQTVEPDGCQAIS